MANSYDMANDEGSAKFLRLIIKADSGMFVVQDYYLDGTLKLLARSINQEMNFESSAHGICMDYYPNGKKKEVKHFYKGKIVGPDTTFFSNTNAYNVTLYTQDGERLNTCTDTTGKKLAENGNGTWIEYGEQNDTFIGQIVNGQKEGVWIRRYPDDNTQYKAEFKNGVEQPGTQRRKEDEVLTAVNQQPRFGGSENALNYFLARNVRYPDHARKNKITGKVILGFVVEKNGMLSNFKVLSSPDESLSQEALRVTKLLPVWIPGMVNGKPVRVNFTIPVAFALAED
ncbi:energy transducer TonB [Mucilaginibacter pedocola]|uniref:TonB C-terminal domain-containing protein n=1 Tax=Mucilaginibacter pedocola TaxID=1792845 RepID=A0A1S9PLK5_9SPHI|nr:energy transducer TonB [Mucilaginibacter pedocola]OOQ61819.1 hypothetical protein BC343_01765 [Mucilaginibacter pedocola]